MKTAIVLALALSLTAPAFAQMSSPDLRDKATIQTALSGRAPAARRDTARHDRSRPPQAVSTRPNDDPWPKRHAVLLGALVGFGGGFVIGASTCNFPTAEGDSCDDYTFPGNARLLGGFYIGGFGAAIGAGLGAIIRASR